MRGNIITMVMSSLKSNSPGDLIDFKVLHSFLTSQVKKINKCINVLEEFNISVVHTDLLKERDTVEKMLIAVNKISSDKFLLGVFITEYLKTHGTN